MAHVLDERWKRAFVVRRDNRDFILYAGLLDLAHKRGLKNITTNLIQIPSELNGMCAIVHATVDTEQGTFMGLGDASPSNVTRMMAPHLIRMAETRAKARALRDAVNIGMTSFEELGDTAHDDTGAAEPAWGGTASAPSPARSSGAAPRPVPQLPTGPARPEQLAAIARLMVAAGETVDTEGMTAERAGREIIRLQDVARSRSNGPAGGPR